MLQCSSYEKQCAVEKSARAHRHHHARRQAPARKIVFQLGLELRHVQTLHVDEFGRVQRVGARLAIGGINRGTMRELEVSAKHDFMRSD